MSNITGVNNYTNSSGTRNTIEDFGVAYREIFNNEGVFSGLTVTATSPVSPAVNISTGYFAIDCGNGEFVFYRLKTAITNLTVPNTGAACNYLVVAKVDLDNATIDFSVVQGSTGVDPNLVEGGSPRVYYVVIARITMTATVNVSQSMILQDALTLTNNSTPEIIYRRCKLNVDESQSVKTVGPDGNADYIVTGSGDEVAINQALKDATASGTRPGVVYLMPFNYSTNGAIQYYSNVSIIGIGGSAEVSLQKAASQSSDMFVNITSVGSGGNTNVVFQGFSVDMNKANNGSSSASGIRGNLATNITCKDVKIANAKGNGFYFRDGAHHIRLEDCFSTSCDTHAVSFLKTDSNRLHHVTIVRGEFSLAVNQGLNFDNVDNVEVFGARCFSNTKNGIAGFYINNWLIKDCELYSNTQSGADIEGAVNGGYEANWSHDNTLNGLVIERYPISNIRSTGCYFINNFLYNNAQGGITVQASDDTTILGNKGYNNSTGDITYPALVYIKYEGSDNTSYCKGGTITGNTYIQVGGGSNPQYIIAENGSSPNLGSKDFFIGGNALQITGNSNIIKGVRMAGVGSANVNMPNNIYDQTNAGFTIDPYGSWNINGQTVTNAGNASSSQDLVTLIQVKGLAGYGPVITIGTQAGKSDFVCTGTNDDAVFTTALAAVVANNPGVGGMLFVKTGTYFFSGTVNVPSKCAIVGQDRVSTLIKSNGSGVTLFQFLGLTGEANYTFDQVLSNMEVRGDNNPSNTGNFGLIVKYATNFLVHRVFFRQCYSAFEVFDSYRGYFMDCVFKESQAHGGRLSCLDADGNTRDVAIKDCIFDTCSGSGQLLYFYRGQFATTGTPCFLTKNMLVDNCVFYNAAQASIRNEGNSLRVINCRSYNPGFHNYRCSSDGLGSINCSFEGCYGTGAGQNGMYFDNDYQTITNLRVRDCWIENSAQQGIAMQGALHYEFDGVVVKNSGFGSGNTNQVGFFLNAATNAGAGTSRNFDRLTLRNCRAYDDQGGGSQTQGYGLGISTSIGAYTLTNFRIDTCDFSGNATGRITPALIPYLLNSAFVKVSITDPYADYIATGTADDVVIQKAISDLVTRFGGGTVIIDPGTYNLTAVIDVPSGVSIMGLNQKGTIIKTNGNNITAFQFLGATGEGNYKIQQSIKNLTILGNNNVGNTSNYGILIKYAKAFLIQDVVIDQCYYSIAVFDAFDGTVEDCRFTNATSHGTRLSCLDADGNTRDITFRRCLFDTCGTASQLFYGYRGTGSTGVTCKLPKDITLDTCTFRNATRSSILWEGYGLHVVHCNSYSPSFHHIQITSDGLGGYDNVIHDFHGASATLNGVNIDDTYQTVKDIVIRDSRFTACGQDGMVIAGTTNTLIDKVRIKNSGFGSGGVTYSGIIVTVNNAAYIVNNLQIKNSHIYDDQGTKTQKYGVTISTVTGTVSGINIKDCDLTGNATGNYNSALQTYMKESMIEQLDMGSNKIINVTDPTNAQDAATKNYVDTVASGLSPKDSVIVATTAALPTNTYSNGASGVGATLTGTATGVLTIDGHTVALNDRILVKNEVTGANNGVYSCTTAGAIGVAYVLTRTTDFDQPAEFPGAYTFVEIGTTNGAAGFVCTNSSNPTIGTTAITFTQFSGAGELVAGSGISITGNTITASNITDSNISASAAIAFSKLAALTSGNILVGNGSNVAVSVTPSGDSTFSNVGVITHSNTFPRSIYRARTNVTINNSAAETTIFDQAVAGGTLGTGNWIEGEIWCSCLNNTGGNVTLTATLYYGATTIIATPTANIATNVNTKGMRITFFVGADGATGAQKGTIQVANNLTSSGVAYGYGTASEDSTASKNLKVTITLSTANNNYTVVAMNASFRVVTP